MIKIVDHLDDEDSPVFTAVMICNVCGDYQMYSFPDKFEDVHYGTVVDELNSTDWKAYEPTGYDEKYEEMSTRDYLAECKVLCPVHAELEAPEPDIVIRLYNGERGGLEWEDDEAAWAVSAPIVSDVIGVIAAISEARTGKVHLQLDEGMIKKIDQLING